MDIRKKVIAWAGAALLVAAGTVSVAAIANPAGPDQAPATIVQEQPAVVDLEPEAPEPTQQPVAPVPAPEPAPVVEAPAPPPPAPVKCPSGTRANAVDAAGNESACEPLGPQGQQCVAYNDQNQCTAYLES